MKRDTPAVSPPRWTAWSAARAARWQRRSQWLEACPFVWRARRKLRSSLLLRIVRLYAPSLAVQLFPQLSLTFHAAVDRQVSVGRAAPGASAIERAIPRLHRSAITRATRPSQPAGSLLSIPMRVAPAGIARPYRGVTADQPMEITQSRARRDVLSDGTSPVSRLIRRRQRHETEVADSSSRVFVRQPQSGSIGEPAPVAPRSPAAAPQTADHFNTPPMARPAASLNVEQLTEQVMRQIDRRVTAWRERMGRA